MEIGKIEKFAYLINSTMKSFSDFSKLIGRRNLSMLFKWLHIKNFLIINFTEKGYSL